MTEDRWYQFWFWILPQWFKCVALGWHTVDFSDYEAPSCTKCRKVWK